MSFELLLEKETAQNPISNIYSVLIGRFWSVNTKLVLKSY